MINFFKNPLELEQNTSSDRQSSRLSIEEAKYQWEQKRLKITKQKSAQAYLLRKLQEKQGKKLEGDKAEKEYKKQMEFRKRLEKQPQRD